MQLPAVQFVVIKLNMQKQCTQMQLVLGLAGLRLRLLRLKLGIKCLLLIPLVLNNA